jgi:hypothetical protein
MEVHVKQAIHNYVKEIAELKDGLLMIINFIPEGWPMPLGWNIIVNQAKELIGDRS